MGWDRDSGVASIIRNHGFFAPGMPATSKDCLAEEMAAPYFSWVRE